MKNNEIGSEFYNLETSENAPLPPWFDYKGNIQYYLSGRSALSGIIKDICIDGKKHSVYMPSYCCHTMIEPFVKSGVDIVFYDVIATQDGIECLYDANNNCDILFKIDYFGYKNVTSPVFYGKKIIKDCTHSILRNENFAKDCNYAFASLRKWSAIDMGFAIKNNGEFKIKPVTNQGHVYVGHRQDARTMKKDYFNNLVLDKTPFLKMFSQAEKGLDLNYENEAFVGSQEEYNILKKFNISFVKQQRQANAKLLIDGINSLQKPNIRLMYPKMKSEDCPLFVPIIVERSIRNQLKQHLVKNDIYTPIHWPLSDLHKITNRAKQLYDTELSLICDQRYNQTDMYRTLTIIESFHK